MGRDVAHAGQRRACLQIASTPEVPFCAAVMMAVAVVLARCSAPVRVRSIADSGAVGGTHSTGCRDLEQPAHSPSPGRISDRMSEM